MGQHWLLFNLDKHEFAPCFGAKLLEVFFNLSESVLLNLLLSDQPGHTVWGGDRIILVGGESEGLPPDTVTDGDPAILQDHLSTASCVYDWADTCKQVEDINDASGRLPENTVYILRSLNKKEYVRRDIVENYRPLPEQEKPGFSQVLCTLVGWSRGSYFGSPYDSDGYVPASGGTTVCLHRGRWSGNRLDIMVLTDELQKTLNDEGWTDISEEKARHVSDLYASIGY